MSVLRKERVKQAPLLLKKVAECPAQASAYAKCVASTYQNIQKDSCLEQFLALKACVQRK